MRKFFIPIIISLVLATGNAFPVELLTNGGFETGDLTGWDHTLNVVARETHFGVNSYEGSYMAVLAPLGIANADLSQIFDPTGFPAAIVSFAYNLQATDIALLPLIEPEDSLTVSIDSIILLKVSLNDAFGGGSTIQGWRKFSTTLPGALLTGPLTFNFHVENLPPGGDPDQLFYAYVDSVSVDASPPGKVKGGGWFVQNRFRRNLMVEVEYTSGKFTSILVKYLNHSNRLSMQATSISSFVISGNTAKIKGDCTVNGALGYTFELEIKNTNPDSFAITIKDAGGATVDSASGTVAGGDFTVVSY